MGVWGVLRVAEAMESMGKDGNWKIGVYGF